MLGSIGSMQSIVNAVDTYSSMTVGNGYKPDYEKVAYHTVCKELISRLKTIQKDKNLEIVVTVDPKLPPTIYIDEMLFKSVIIC